MGKTYATSDWHGSEIGFTILDYLQPNDTLYFLGDVIDRGKYGIQLFNKLILDPRVIYLKGNHEVMMEESIPYMIEGHYSELWRWDLNGNENTLESLEKLSDDSKMWYVKKIRQMPEEVIYHSPAGHSVILEHAGFSPFIPPHRSHNPVWDRKHFYDEWEGAYDYEDLDPKTTYLVHGHTPVQSLTFEYGYKGQTKEKEELLIGHNWYSPEVNYKPNVIRYCDGHKFDIDMCTIISDRIALLDLDTFEAIYFNAERNNNDEKILSVYME